MAIRCLQEVQLTEINYGNTHVLAISEIMKEYSVVDYRPRHSVLALNSYRPLFHNAIYANETNYQCPEVF